MSRNRRESVQPVTYDLEEKDGVWQSSGPPKKLEGAKPATTPEGRERQLVGLAVSLAEKQLRDGTASSAVIVHYLKLASKREALERDILEKQSKLIESKAAKLAKDGEQEDLAKKAINAMKSYTSGSQNANL